MRLRTQRELNRLIRDGRAKSIESNEFISGADARYSGGDVEEADLNAVSFFSFFRPLIVGGKILG
jgi:hypothetical protein